jgi:hypothetical protein
VRLTAYRTCSRGSPFPSTHSFARKKSGKYQVIKMAAQHGGFRKGADRPKGSRNRATIALEAWQREALAAARAENANLSAIDYLLQTLPTTPPGRRAKVTMFVAPYLKYRVRVSQTVAGEQNQGLSDARDAAPGPCTRRRVGADASIQNNSAWPQ